MDVEVIAACKKCGGTGVIMRGKNGYFIQCVQCSVKSNDYEHMYDVIENWNFDNRQIKIGECKVLASCLCKEHDTKLHLHKKWDGTHWNFWVLVEEDGNNHAVEFNNLFSAVDCLKEKLTSHLV